MKSAILFFITVIFLFGSQAEAFTIGENLPVFHGFLEADYGYKIGHDSTKRDDYNLLEQRLQLKTRYYPKEFLAGWNSEFFFRGDFTVDEYFSGKTNFDLREVNFAFTPADFMDVKIGRQVFTWGTGDYIFINDMFPKDYVSFFIGRNDEYLKKPSDAVKFSFFPNIASIDFIVMPHFVPNIHAKGDRLSFFDSFQQGIAGTNSERELVEPAYRMSNNEYALRIYRNIGRNEAAFYYFRGFDKSPRSYKNEFMHQLYYERVDVYGASIRSPFWGGIGNAEAGYVNSRDDSGGTNRLIENSMVKAMFGYSKDLGSDLKIGFQYYYEQKLDYDNYLNSLLPMDYFWDKYRHMLTNRITKFFRNQTVMLSLFTFYSPSDKDGYFRPSISYDVTDHLKTTLGANVPWGEDDITEFGQMKKNKNIYVRVRYSF